MDVSSTRPVLFPEKSCKISPRAWREIQSAGKARKKPPARTPPSSGTGQPCALGGTRPSPEYSSPTRRRKSYRFAAPTRRKRSIPMVNESPAPSSFSASRATSCASRPRVPVMRPCQKTHPFQLVDGQVGLRLFLQEDLRPGGQSYRRECQNHPHRQCDDGRSRHMCRQISPPLFLKDCVPVRKKNRKLNLPK